MKSVTATGRTEPMKVHKNLVIRHLQKHPEDFELVVGESAVDLPAYLAALEKAPGQYFVGGELEES